MLYVISCHIFNNFTVFCFYLFLILSKCSLQSTFHFWEQTELHGARSGEYGGCSRTKKLWIAKILAREEPLSWNTSFGIFKYSVGEFLISQRICSRMFKFQLNTQCHLQQKLNSKLKEMERRVIIEKIPAPPTGIGNDGGSRRSSSLHPLIQKWWQSPPNKSYPFKYNKFLDLTKYFLPD